MKGRRVWLEYDHLGQMLSNVVAAASAHVLNDFTLHDVGPLALLGDFTGWAERFEGETFAQKPTWKQRRGA